MRLFRWMLVGAIVLAVMGTWSGTTLVKAGVHAAGAVAHTARSLRDQAAQDATEQPSAADSANQDTYRNVCSLVGTWQHLDGAARHDTAAMLLTLTSKVHTGDPALSAFLSAVPAAVGKPGPTATSALGLIARECGAHQVPLR